MERHAERDEEAEKVEDLEAKLRQAENAASASSDTVQNELHALEEDAQLAKAALAKAEEQRQKAALELVQVRAEEQKFKTLVNSLEEDKRGMEESLKSLRAELQNAQERASKAEIDVKIQKQELEKLKKTDSIGTVGANFDDDSEEEDVQPSKEKEARTLTDKDARDAKPKGVSAAFLERFGSKDSETPKKEKKSADDHGVPKTTSKMMNETPESRGKGYGGSSTKAATTSRKAQASASTVKKKAGNVTTTKKKRRTTRKKKKKKDRVGENGTWR